MLTNSQRKSIVVLLCLSLMLSRVSSLIHFKGDPGELGDTSLDLGAYIPDETGILPRQKRTIIFPSGSKFTVQNKFEIPLFSKYDGNITGTFKGTIFVRYTAANTVAFLGRRSIGSERSGAYNSLSSMLTSFGLNGSGCVLRAVCEMAQDPVAGYGVLGEILRMFLTPTHNLSADAREELREFTEAERQGRSLGKCDEAYGDDCPLSLEMMIHKGISAMKDTPQMSMRRRRRRARVEL